MPRRSSLTTPDLVVLALLGEAAMHGYALNHTLSVRDVRDWAAVSPAQVYYSLRKLADLGHIAPAEDVEGGGEGKPGPERQVWRRTPAGGRALAEALARTPWATQRSRPPFLTWLALSSHAPRRTVQAQIARRRQYLQRELLREEETLASLRALDPEAMVPAARLMVDLTVRQFRMELAWLADVEDQFLR